MMNKDDLNKRMILLESQLTQKKTLVDKELFQIEVICKELISLKDKLSKLIEDEQNSGV